MDYNEKFALIARSDTIRVANGLIAFAAQKKWYIYQLNAKSTFLNGYLEEEIYVEQPLRSEIRGEENKALKLKKALYGLKQALQTWCRKIDIYFTNKEYGGVK